MFGDSDNEDGELGDDLEAGFPGDIGSADQPLDADDNKHSGSEGDAESDGKEQETKEEEVKE